MRVMLAGHAGLFAPPELQLLSFNDLHERQETFSGRYQFWLEGTFRALMEIKHCQVEEAKQTMQEFEARKLPTQEFYRYLQELIAPRRLVDKTPAYTFDLATLKRAEDYFEDARYIHLLRHPGGMIRSFEDAKLDQIFRYQHPYSTRELAEILWNISHQNILEFLREVPRERQQQVKFEDLVKEPEAVMRSLCLFLGLEFDAAMLEPHRGQESKMTDGVHGLSRMLGDIKFHTHQTIDPRIADRWRTQQRNDDFAEITWGLADSLGYERPHHPAGSADELAASQSTRLTELRPLPRGSKTRSQVL
jgi:hypothetical protein